MGYLNNQLSDESKTVGNVFSSGDVINPFQYQIWTLESMFHLRHANLENKKKHVSLKVGRVKVRTTNEHSYKWFSTKHFTAKTDLPWVDVVSYELHFELGV